jgi:hypothetical protein
MFVSIRIHVVPHWKLAAGLMLGLSSLFFTSCAQPTPEAPKGNEQVQPEYSSDGRLTRLTYDRDGDGKIDTWGFMDGARVIRVEVDEDGDGKVDRWEYHSTKTGCEGAGCEGAPPGMPQQSAGNATPDKTIERIERATRHDGKITRREFFEQGTLARVEEDTDADGLVDKWETYTNGALSLMAIDSQHRGIPDRRMVYGPDGSFLRVETDPAGTGTFKPLKP